MSDGGPRYGRHGWLEAGPNTSRPVTADVRPSSCFRACPRPRFPLRRAPPASPTPPACIVVADNGAGRPLPIAVCAVRHHNAGCFRLTGEHNAPTLFGPSRGTRSATLSRDHARRRLHEPASASGSRRRGHSKDRRVLQKTQHGVPTPSPMPAALTRCEVAPTRHRSVYVALSRSGDTAHSKVPNQLFAENPLRSYAPAAGMRSTQYAKASICQISS